MKNALNVAIATTIAIGFGALTAGAQDRGTMRPGLEQRRFESMCSTGEQPKAVKASMEDQLSKFLLLSDSQKSALNDVHNAFVKGRDDTKSLCSSKPDFTTVPGRMAYDESMLEARLNGLKEVRAKMDVFYSSLNDEQKAKFNRGFAPNQDRGPLGGDE